MGWNHQLEMLVENLYHCLISAMFLFGFYHLNLVEHESMKLHMIDDCLEVGCPLPPGLIAFNKYLMNADRFPYAKAMTAMHMAMTTFMSLLLYTCAPSLYPSMGKAKENWRTSISPREVVFFFLGGGKYPKNGSHGLNSKKLPFVACCHQDPAEVHPSFGFSFCIGLVLFQPGVSLLQRGLPPILQGRQCGIDLCHVLLARFAGPAPGRQLGWCWAS